MVGGDNKELVERLNGYVKRIQVLIKEDTYANVFGAIYGRQASGDSRTSKGAMEHLAHALYMFEHGDTSSLATLQTLGQGHPEMH